MLLNHWNDFYCDVLWVQSSVLLLILSGTACTVELNGEDSVVAVEVQNMSPVQMGNIRVSDLLAGIVQGKITGISDLCFSILLFLLCPIMIAYPIMGRLFSCCLSRPFMWM